MFDDMRAPLERSGVPRSPLWWNLIMVIVLIVLALGMARMFDYLTTGT